MGREGGWINQLADTNCAVSANADQIMFRFEPYVHFLRLFRVGDRAHRGWAAPPRGSKEAENRPWLGRARGHLRGRGAAAGGYAVGLKR